MTRYSRASSEVRSFESEMLAFEMIPTILSLLITMSCFPVNSGDTSARVRGELVIGALFPVHLAPRGGKDALTCGHIRETYGIQRVETALITLDKINRDNTILPGCNKRLQSFKRRNTYKRLFKSIKTYKFIANSVHR